MPSEPLIQLEDVTARALRDPKRIVAAHVDWTVQPGDYWVIGGLQGSGKTDFLLTLGGIAGPQHGTYRFAGELMPIFEDARLPHRLRLGLVFETGQLFNQLTIRDNVALPLAYHRNLDPAEAGVRVQSLLERMELLPWAETTPGALGRNWQRRVGLARALVLEPELLLIDNPLSGVDLGHIHWWLDFLDRLNRGQERSDGKPVAIVATASDLRPWRGRARQFATLREQRFTVLGDFADVEGTSAEFLADLLMGEPSAGTGSADGADSPS